MRIICIKPIKRDPNSTDKWSVIKGLKEENSYYLYEGYTIEGDFIHKENRNVPDNLFSPNRYAAGMTNATFSVDICAIVGENGAGKSTLVDIYIRLINNLAAFIFGENFLYPKAEHLHFIRGVFAEAYIEIVDKIYCIRCNDGTLEVLQFNYNSDKSSEICLFERVKPNVLYEVIDATKICESHLQYLDKLGKLCYNIVINYSLHSYNSVSYRAEDTIASKEKLIRIKGFNEKLYSPKFMLDENGKPKKITEALLKNNFEEGFSWLSGVFHKNDGFQTPIVITPKRDYGQIDVNNENKLAEERLMSLLFVENKAEKRKGEKRFPFSEINEKLRIDGFTISADWEMVNYYKKDPEEHPDLPHFSKTEFANLRDFIKKEYIQKFGLDEVNRHYKNAAINYLIMKTIKIFMTYPRYQEMRNNLVNSKSDQIDLRNDKLKDFLTKLWNDHSHITVKLRRTLNYLRYDHIGKSKSFQIHKLATKIDTIIEQNTSNSNHPAVETDEMLPPPIFAIDFLLYDKKDVKKEHKIPFSTMSSGEKQITYILCSLYYYMLCLDSAHRYSKNIQSYKNDSNHIEYEHINIIFDEIELYFHPEMQRTFISTLLHGLQQLPFKKIKSLHFMMVTHSPFVLSDIPIQNILFLEKNGQQASKKDMVSFGANIHTMLVNNFFLKGGAMGQFAKETIKNLLNQVNALYIWNKIEKDGDIKSIIDMNFQIYKSLPDEYQDSLKNKTFDKNSMVDFQYIKCMTYVIQEPIIRQRIKEILEKI